MRRLLLRVLFLVLLACCARAQNIANLLLLDGTQLESVRLLFVDEKTDFVFLTHRGGVCNLPRSLFPPETLGGLMVWDSSQQPEAVAEDAPPAIFEPTPVVDAHSATKAMSPAGYPLAAPSTGPKPVHVRGYVRKDGTLVHSYDRSLPRKR